MEKKPPFYLPIFIMVLETIRMANGIISIIPDCDEGKSIIYSNITINQIRSATYF